MSEKITSELIKTLIGFNESFQSEQNKLLALNKQQRTINTELKIAENNLKIGIMEAKDGEKKRFSNQEKRDSALITAKNTDNVYKESKDKYNEVSDKIKGCIAELDILKFQQRGILKISDLVLGVEQIRPDLSPSFQAKGDVIVEKQEKPNARDDMNKKKKTV